MKPEMETELGIGKWPRCRRYTCTDWAKSLFGGKVLPDDFSNLLEKKETCHQKVSVNPHPPESFKIFRLVLKDFED